MSIDDGRRLGSPWLFHPSVYLRHDKKLRKKNVEINPSISFLFPKNRKIEKKFIESRVNIVGQNWPIFDRLYLCPTM
jgi:hypothetical protein